MAFSPFLRRIQPHPLSSIKMYSTCPPFFHHVHTTRRPPDLLGYTRQNILHFTARRRPCSRWTEYFPVPSSSFEESRWTKKEEKCTQNLLFWKTSQAKSQIARDEGRPNALFEGVREKSGRREGSPPSYGISSRKEEEDFVVAGLTQIW